MIIIVIIRTILKEKKWFLLIWVQVWLHYENILHLLLVIKSYFRILSCNCFGTRCHYDLSFSRVIEAGIFFNTIKDYRDFYRYSSMHPFASKRCLAGLSPTWYHLQIAAIDSDSMGTHWIGVDAKCVSR